MTEQEKRTHRCCFTGHRPEKLLISESEVKAELENKYHTGKAGGFITALKGIIPAHL